MQCSFSWNDCCCCGWCCQMWQAILLYPVGHCSHRGRTVLIFPYYLLYDIYITWYIIIVDILQHTEQAGNISIASELYLELSSSRLGRDTSCPDMFLSFPSVPPVKCQNITLGHDHILSEPVHHESLIPLWMLYSKCK